MESAMCCKGDLSLSPRKILGNTDVAVPHVIMIIFMKYSSNFDVMKKKICPDY